MSIWLQQGCCRVIGEEATVYMSWPQRQKSRESPCNSIEKIPEKSWNYAWKGVEMMLDNSVLKTLEICQFSDPCQSQEKILESLLKGSSTIPKTDIWQFQKKVFNNSKKMLDKNSTILKKFFDNSKQLSSTIPKEAFGYSKKGFWLFQKGFWQFQKRCLEIPKKIWIFSNSKKGILNNSKKKYPRQYQKEILEDSEKGSSTIPTMDPQQFQNGIQKKKTISKKKKKKKKKNSFEKRQIKKKKF